MNLTKKAPVKVLVSAIIITTFLYSQILWAAGYELFSMLDQEDPLSDFRPTEESMIMKTHKEIYHVY